MKQDLESFSAAPIWLMGAGGLIGGRVRRLCNRRILIWSVQPAPLTEEQGWIQEPFLPWLDPEPAPFPGFGLIIAFGTTLAKAGSVEAFRRIDVDMPLNMAAYARSMGVKRVAVVSAAGASEGSRNYYLKSKGDLETGLRALDFESLSILRPSLLLGHRKEKRRGERFAQLMAPVWGALMVGPLQKYRPIGADVLARALLQALEQGKPGVEVYEGAQLFELGR